ncbi:hypothetical protein KJ991_01360 [Patescibacteria group bacterium]|nr:hypothetical protein [Patescibacteria group bacterium]MBU4057350.1 hypothetical protein [Patescibacteria group bacterium]MBU4115821.1 hypothetical protein [Patescibacteria group bacterium]
MDQEIKQKIEKQSVKIDAIYKSVEKTRKYFQITLWIIILLFVLPLVALIFIVPSFLSSYTNALGGL